MSEKLRAGNDIRIETVVAENQTKKRIFVPIETCDAMPINKGQVIFEFHTAVAPSNTQCKNVVDNFVKRLK